MTTTPTPEYIVGFDHTDPTTTHAYYVRDLTAGRDVAVRLTRDEAAVSARGWNAEAQAHRGTTTTPGAEANAILRIERTPGERREDRAYQLRDLRPERETDLLALGLSLAEAHRIIEATTPAPVVEIVPFGATGAHGRVSSPAMSDRY